MSKKIITPNTSATAIFTAAKKAYIENALTHPNITEVAAKYANNANGATDGANIRYFAITSNGAETIYRLDPANSVTWNTFETKVQSIISVPLLTEASDLDTKKDSDVLGDDGIDEEGI